MRACTLCSISTVKPALDRALSFAGLIVFSPLMLSIALAVVIDDPGPVFFIQKRVGKNGSFFQLHKFRTMKMSAPHDVPTHELKDTDQYITRVGAFLRKTSLDELPQIWDIFRGKMSVVSPRPALWNQDDLVALRSSSDHDYVDANSVLPGLTGLAQIKGRDGLELEVKAKYDKEYVMILKQGGWKAFLQDCRILCGTLVKVLKHDGVVEGGTGSSPDSSDGFQTKVVHGLTPVNPEDVGFGEYGHKKHFSIDKNVHKRVLITGANSYIGESFKNYVEKHYPNIEITIIDMVDGSWRSHSFTDESGQPFDTVFYVAGIAHVDVCSITEEQKKLYYSVNSSLAIETAEKAKAANCSQFIYMSSMIIYGRQEYVYEHTIPAPSNFYGDSKWQGDLGVRRCAGDGFHVAVLRPPMIYGKGSKGNYPTISRIAKVVPFFPEVKNTRSMLYIENLCEFVAMLTLSGEGGIYFPQNSDYVSIAWLVREISNTVNHTTYMSRALNPAVFLAKHIPVQKVSRLANKAFGSSWYDQELSVYEGIDYQKYGLTESIQRTESRG